MMNHKPDKSADPQSDWGLILMYHRVAPVVIDPWKICVRPETFAEQLAYIQTHFHPLPLGDLVDALSVGELPPRSVALTFDDGYLDNLEAAEPLLSRYEIPATLFTATGSIGAKAFWWDRLDPIFLHSRRLPPQLTLETPSGQLNMDIGDAVSCSAEQLAQDLRAPAWRARKGSRLDLLFECWKVIRTLDVNQRNHTLAELDDWAGCNSLEAVTGRPMTTSELSKIASSDWVEIGAHSIDHPALPDCDAYRKRLEVSESKTQLETWLGSPVEHFAYPHGEFDDECRDLVQRAGYKTACATNIPEFPMATSASDRFALPRRGISTDGVCVLKKYITGG